MYGREMAKTLFIFCFLVSAVLVDWRGNMEKTYAQSEIIVDNVAAVVSGSWTTSTFKPNVYGSNYLFKAVGTGAATVRWTPVLPTGGTYAVYYWLPEGAPDRASNAAFRIQHTGGSDTYFVNEQDAGGQWIPLAVHEFAAGSSGYVELNDNASNDFVIADAIKFVPLDVIVDNDGSAITGAWTASTFKPNYYGADYRFKTTGTGSAAVRWTPDIPVEGQYAAYYWLPDGGSDRTSYATYKVVFQGGIQTYSVNQQSSGG